MSFPFKLCFTLVSNFTMKLFLVWVVNNVDMTGVLEHKYRIVCLLQSNNILKSSYLSFSLLKQLRIICLCTEREMVFTLQHEPNKYFLLRRKVPKM